MFRRWRWLVAGTSMASMILLLANTSAFSLKLSPPPYTVDSEIRHYLNENIKVENIEDVARVSNVKRIVVSPALTLTSYNEAGNELIRSASFPNQALKSVLGKILLVFWDAADMFEQVFMLSSDEDADAFAVVDPSAPRNVLVVGSREALMSSGCQTSHAGAKVIGEGVILNYHVTVVQQPLGAGMQMVTLWMAPKLSCFALRATIHAKQPDGTWKLISEKQAVKVTVNP
jgi:hypothetical protein